MVGAQDPGVLASFTKGEIQLTHGDTPYTFPLEEGQLQSLTLPAPGTREHVRMLKLAYAKAGSRVVIVLSGVSGPGRFDKRNIVTFSVLTPSGPTVLRQQGADCIFTLTRADTHGVEGTATCTGELSDVRGNKGVRVSGVKFSAGR